MTRTALLARMLLARFFESELLPPGLPQVQLVVWSLSLLAAPGVLLPLRMVNKYSFLEADPAAMARALLVDRLVFITLSMTAMGFVALVLWENVFPDRRDARQLGVLPLRGRVLITARLWALTMLAGIFLVGVNAIPTVIYGPLVGLYGGASNPFQGVVAHLIATMGAGLFVFFALIAIQGTLLNLGRRFAERFALVLQVLFVVALLQQLLFLPRLGSYLAADLRSVAVDPVLRWVPSFWFLGLYDELGGRAAAGSAELAAAAVIATLATVMIAVVMLAATHGRMMRMALEGREPTRKGARVFYAALGPLVTLVCRSPVAGAIFAFSLRTLLRSRSHRLLLSLYLGFALAVAIVVVSPVVVRHGVSGFARPTVAVMAIPLVFQFFTLVGLRLLIGIPVEPKANWIVRLLEPADRRQAISGVRTALIVVGVLPASALGAFSAVVLWGLWPALTHGTVCLLAGWLLTELLLVRLRKIPFTCTYSPGRSRIQLWPLYLVAFSNYCFTTAAIDLSLVGSPRGFVAFVGILLGIIVALRMVTARALAAPPGLRFEEEDPDAIFEGFRLSEGFAARADRAASR